MANGENLPQTGITSVETEGDVTVRINGEEVEEGDFQGGAGGQTDDGEEPAAPEPSGGSGSGQDTPAPSDQDAAARDQPDPRQQLSQEERQLAQRLRLSDRFQTAGELNVADPTQVGFREVGSVGGTTFFVDPGDDRAAEQFSQIRGTVAEQRRRVRENTDQDDVFIDEQGNEFERQRVSASVRPLPQERAAAAFPGGSDIIGATERQIELAEELADSPRERRALIRAQQQAQELGEGGFTQAEQLAFQNRVARVQRQEQAGIAAGRRQELAQNLEQVRDAPEGATFRINGEEVGRQEAISRIESARTELSGFISDTEEDIQILESAEQAALRTDPRGGTTTRSFLENLSPTEQAGVSAQIGFSPAAFRVLGEAATGGDPSQVVREQVDRIRTGDLTPGQAALEAGIGAPTAVAAQGIGLGAVGARTAQIARGVSSTTGTAARAGLLATGAGTTALEGRAIFRELQEGDEAGAVARSLRFGTAAAGAVAGARAMQPRIVSESTRTVRGRSAIQQQGQIGRGSGQASVVRTQTVQQPRLLRSPKTVTRQFFTDIQAGPIKTGPGGAAGRLTGRTFRVGQGRSIPTGPRQVATFETGSVPVGASTRFPFTVQSPSATVSRSLSVPVSSVIASGQPQPFSASPGVFKFTQNARTVGARVQSIGGAQQTQLGTQLQLSRVETPQGSVTQTVTFGQSGQGTPFQGAGRITRVQSSAVPSLSRSGGTTTTRTGGGDLDIELLAQTAAEIFGTGGQTGARTGTALPALPPVFGDDGGSDGAVLEAEQEDIDTAEAPAAPLTDVSQEGIGFTDPVISDTGTEQDTEAVTDEETGGGFDTRLRPLTSVDPDIDTGPVQREAPEQRGGIEQAPAAVQRPRRAFAVRPTLTSQQVAAQRARASVFATPSFIEPATLNPTAGGLSLPLAAEGPAFTGFEPSDEEAPGDDLETGVDIDIISANLAEFETGQATRPGPAEQEQFRRRRAAAGPVTRLRAQEVISGEAQRLKPADVGDNILV